LAVQWIREKFYQEFSGGDGYERLFADASTIGCGAEGLLLLPYFAGERNPHWNAQARALIEGLGLEHDRRHIARAVLEGAGFCLVDIWEAMQSGSQPGAVLPEQARLTGMINSRPVWAQILCDQVGFPLAGLEAADASAVGAALFGHVVLGNLTSFEEAAKLIQPTFQYRPDPANHSLYTKLHKQFQSLYHG
jgi:sugar (pentulose or hexulose) kinase